MPTLSARLYKATLIRPGGAKLDGPVAWSKDFWEGPNKVVSGTEPIQHKPKSRRERVLEGKLRARGHI